MGSTKIYAGILGALFILKCSADATVHDRLADVTYHGTTTENGIEHFQNIKYALDTSGSRRFAPPVPYKPSPGTIIDATTRGPACPQLPDPLPPFFSAEPELSEDCLSVYIARPADDAITSESRLPVLVWIHGGGVVKGSAYDEHSDPNKLLQLSKENGEPIIYAALNWRVGVFGFARSESLKAEKSLNAGFRDQRAGLEWIRDNIATFGGDPTRITVFGLSAGGTMITAHHIAYGGEKGVPFTQAFMMSGSHGTFLNATTDATAIHTRNLAGELGCTTSNETDMISCLRNVPMETLRDAGMQYSIANHPPNGLFTFIPSADGDIIPDRTSKLLREGRFAKGIPSILAWTEDDGAMNAGPSHLINNEDDMKASIMQFATSLTDLDLSNLFALYPVEDFHADVENYEARKAPDDPTVSPHYFRLARLLRDVLYTCSSFDFTYQMVKHTRASGVDPTFSNVRHYTLNQSMLTPLWAAFGMPYVQVSHGSDQNYVFNGVFPESPVSDTDLELSRAFSSSIINFVATGDPVSKSSSSNTFKDWPVAYTNVEDEHEDRVMPIDFSLLVIGGPFGTTPVSVSDTSSKSAEGEIAGDRLGKMQQMLGNAFNYGVMASANSAKAKEVVEAQKLSERCEYILSLGELLGN